jgi:hypothetical protein
LTVHSEVCPWTDGAAANETVPRLAAAAVPLNRVAESVLRPWPEAGKAATPVPLAGVVVKSLIISSVAGMGEVVELTAPDTVKPTVSPAAKAVDNGSVRTPVEELYETPDCTVSDTVCPLEFTTVTLYDDALVRALIFWALLGLPTVPSLNETYRSVAVCVSEDGVDGITKPVITSLAEAPGVVELGVAEGAVVLGAVVSVTLAAVPPISPTDTTGAKLVCVEPELFVAPPSAIE